MIRRRFALAAVLCLLFASIPASCARSSPPVATPAAPQAAAPAPPPAPPVAAREPAIPERRSVAKPGRVYMGVGPEQNFTYIAALKPAMAFIVDVRRGNLDLHLMYKALFELSKDRVDFASRLFARKRPEGLTAASSANDIFAALATAETNESLFAENLSAVVDLLTKTHHFALAPDDVPGIEYVYRNFQTYGPGLTYWMGGRGGGFGRNSPSYADLMVSTDESGQPRSYMASEENFTTLKELESKNLLVPLVGNF